MSSVLFNDGQLSMIQVGIMLAEFSPDGKLPEDLTAVTAVAMAKLSVEIKQGEDLAHVRDKVRDGLKRLGKSQTMEF